jgi:hypothetical protein
LKPDALEKSYGVAAAVSPLDRSGEPVIEIPREAERSRGVTQGEVGGNAREPGDTPEDEKWNREERIDERRSGSTHEIEGPK